MDKPDLDRLHYALLVIIAILVIVMFVDYAGSVREKSALCEEQYTSAECEELFDLR